MKKLLVILAVLALTVPILAQSKRAGILFPVKDNLPAVSHLTTDRSVRVISDSTYNTHLVRFAAGVSGVQILYNKVTREITSEAFAKVGIGLSYSFYRVTNGDPFNYLSLNGFLFLPITDVDQTISIAVTASAFNLFGTNISPALGINFEPGNIKSDYLPVGPLLSLKYNF